MCKPSESPPNSVTQETDSSASDNRTIYRRAKNHSQLVVMCVVHIEAWFMNPYSSSDYEVQDLIEHFGAERDCQDDFPCQGTVTVVWQSDPERRQEKKPAAKGVPNGAHRDDQQDGAG